MNRDLDQEISCDITLVAKDGKQFQANRNLLSLASPFFERLLSSDMKENNEGVIRLHTITESQMADILRTRKCREADRSGRFSSPFRS